MKLSPPLIQTLPYSVEPSNVITVLWSEELDGVPLVRCYDAKHGPSCWIREGGRYVIRLDWG